MPATIPPLSSLLRPTMSSARSRSVPATSDRSTPSTTGTALRGDVTRERIAAGPAFDLALRAAAPRRGAGGAAARARLHAARCRAPRLASALGLSEVWLKLDTRTRRTRSRTGSSPWPARRRRSSASTPSPAPRPATSRTPSPPAPPPRGWRRRSSVPTDLEPEKLVATAVYGATIYAVRGTYDDCSPPHGRALLRDALGLRQRRASRLLRRGLEDAWLRDRRAARLGAARRRRRADRLGRDVLEGEPGLRGAARARARRGAAAPHDRGAGGGLRAGGDGVWPRIAG